MAFIVVLATALIALLYPLAVIAEDGTNLGPSPIETMALKATGEANFATSTEHKTKPAPISARTVIGNASVSAFTSSVGETDSTPFTTASGTRVHKGTAACPIRYAFGTRIRVKGNVYVCEDRMNARYQNGNYFDIWMESKSDAIQWGRRTVTVEIL